jgi:hypothetical protein
VSKAGLTRRARHLKCSITRNDVGEPTSPVVYKARRLFIIAALRRYALREIYLNRNMRLRRWVTRQIDGRRNQPEPFMIYF